MSKLLRREIELRHTGGREISGVIVHYGSVAELPFGKEVFKRGAFTGGVGDVILRFGHDRYRPLARTGGGGLEVEDTNDALMLRAALPDTSDGNDALKLVKTGVLRGLSAEFIAVEERFDKQSGVVTIEKAKLMGVGVVDRPAYPDSYVKARMHVYEGYNPDSNGKHKPDSEPEPIRIFL